MRKRPGLIRVALLAGLAIALLPISGIPAGADGGLTGPPDNGNWAYCNVNLRRSSQPQDLDSSGAVYLAYLASGWFSCQYGPTTNHVNHLSLWLTSGDGAGGNTWWNPLQVYDPTWEQSCGSADTISYPYGDLRIQCVRNANGLFQAKAVWVGDHGTAWNNLTVNTTKPKPCEIEEKETEGQFQLCSAVIYSTNAAGFPPYPDKWWPGGNNPNYPGDNRRYSRVVMNDEPKAYYTLGESSGSVAADSSSYGHDGTYAGALEYGQGGGIVGDPDKSVLFGDTIYTRAETNMTTNFTDAFSIEAWFNPASTTSTDQVIVSKSLNTPTAADFTTNLQWKGGTAGVVFNLGTSSASKAIDLSVQTGTVTNAWHHVVATYMGGGSAKIYLDGVLKASKTLSWTVASNSREWVIGRAPAKSSSATWQQFVGRLDEVAIYDAALAAGRVTTHYQAGKNQQITSPRYFLRFEQGGLGSSSSSTIMVYMNHLYQSTEIVTSPYAYRNRAINLGASFTPPDQGAELVQWINTAGDGSSVRYMRLLGDNGDTWSDQYGADPSLFADNNLGHATQSDSAGNLVPSGAFDDHIIGDPAARFIAMGDSYQSGVGTKDDAPYIAGTDIAGTNECKRSTLAHSALLAQHEPALAYRQGGVSGFYDDGFVACGGATTDNILNTGQYNEPAQVTRLSDAVRFLTLGIGGNDMGFSQILTACNGDGLLLTDGACSSNWNQTVQNRLAALAGGKLRDVYTTVGSHAPAQVMMWVMGYPHFFYNDGDNSSDNELGYCLADGTTVHQTDRQWIDSGIQDLDDAISVAVSQSAGWSYVDEYHFSDQTELCNPATQQYLWGIKANGDSFHPTSYGYRVVESNLRSSFDPYYIPGFYTAAAHPKMPSGAQRQVTATRAPKRVGFRVGRTDAVRFGIDTSSTNPTAWLVSPSGHVLRANSKRLLYSSVNGEQVFWVRNPEVGRWSVVLASPAGPQRATVSTRLIDILVKPIAKLQYTRAGANFSFTSLGSRDPDGTVSRYEWSFGDHDYATGPTATHTYKKPGTYVATLIVTDNTGRMGFAFSRKIRVR